MRKRMLCLLLGLLLIQGALGEAWVRVPQSLLQPGWIVADTGNDGGEPVCVAWTEAPKGFSAVKDEQGAGCFASGTARLWLSADASTPNGAAELFVSQLPETKSEPARGWMSIGGRNWLYVCASLAWGAAGDDPWRTLVFLAADGPEGITIRVTVASADPDSAAVLGGIPALLSGLTYAGETSVMTGTGLVWGMRARDTAQVLGETVYTVPLAEETWQAQEYVVTLENDTVAELDCLLENDQLRMILLVPQQMGEDEIRQQLTERLGQPAEADAERAAAAFSLVRPIGGDAFCSAVCWQAGDAELILAAIDDIPVLLVLDPLRFAVQASAGTTCMEESETN